jgi:hypothetical protein
MTFRRVAFAVALLAGWGLTTPARGATVLEREITFGPDRVRLQYQNGHVALATPGATFETRAGHPDLPWFGERVDLPDGVKVTNVELVTLETATVAENVKLPSARIPQANSGAVVRSAPDPAFFTTDQVQPEIPVELGYQGYRRGHHEAWLRVAPVRWTPSSGHLERVTRIVVRLTLSSDSSPEVVKRERVVKEWEDALPGQTDLSSLKVATTSMAPIKGKAQPFQATQVPSLLGSPVEYIIVTNQAMSSQYQRLADWKTQSGIPAAVRTIEFIRQQYPGAADDAERIRDFIRDAYARWGTKWVLLGGDTDVIPTRYGYTTFYGGNYIATDLYFSCLDGNWNADGDSIYGEGYFSADQPGDNCDLLPDVYVGRAPTTTLLQAQQFVDHVFQYSKTPVGDYENTVFFMAEVLFPQDFHPGDFITLDGAELVEEVLPTLDRHPEIHFARLYENYADTSYRPGALPETRAAVLDSLDRGYGLVVHVGHGYRNVMSVGDATLDNNDAAGVTNGNRLFNLYAIDCTSNAIDFPSIGEAFMQASNGGAVSNVGSTNFDFPTAGRVYQDSWFQLMFDDSTTSIGQAQADQKLDYVPYSVYDGVNRWTQFTLLLLGDPEMHMWTNKPRSLTVSHNPSMAVSDSAFAVHVQVGATPLYGARVTLYKANEDFETALTDGAGNVTLPFRPDSLGPMTVTVTAFNARPYQTNVNVTSTSLPLVADPGFTVDDDNVGGTSGNGNGIMDAGETVELRIPLRNNGGSTAPSVVANLTTTDPMVTITAPSVGYGSIAAGAQVAPSSGFRMSTPYTTPDQREIPFKLTIMDGAGHSRIENIQVTIHGPEIEHFRHTVQDLGGNSNGVPDPGETVSYFLVLRNTGTGIAPNVTVKLRNYDGLAPVLDSTATFGDIAPGAEATGDAVVFHPNSASAKLELRISDSYGLLSTQTLDLGMPGVPDQLAAIGSASSITLQWHLSLSSDLFGYNVYRSNSSGGPFTRVNPVPTDRTAYYKDEGLSPLTVYYYRVASVDSSGNESGQSLTATASTNPPTHTIFPIPLGQTTPASVAVEHVYSGYPQDIFAGADVLYAWHPDGSSPVDADGQGTTPGDFTKLGKYYAAGPSIADLDGDGIPEIIAPTWNDSNLYVFTPQGTLKPGFPVHLRDPIWSSVAVADLNNDGHKELIFASNGFNFYVFRDNGTEYMDGDANPATNGVFKVLGQPFNYGSPAVADINNDGYPEIIYGSTDGKVYVWDRFGNNLPGFPVTLNAGINASIAVGNLDGNTDSTLEIIALTTGQNLYVIEPNGTIRPGWSRFVRSNGSSKSPSPALADMNGDGFLDIVIGSTDGFIYVFDRNGNLVPPWTNVRYTSLTAGASESSPVVADINGDGLPDVVMGSEDQTLAAFGNNGQMLPGFPIVLGGEIRGTPALCDCDGDGKTEIVLSGWDKLLHVWDYDFPFSPGHVPQWPQFHHDAKRTGLVTTPILTGVDDNNTTAPTAIEFALPAPNPARTGTRFSYAIPKDRDGQTLQLAIFDLNGRRVRTLASGVAKAGRYSVNWDLRSEGGSAVRTGVYFARFQLGAVDRSHKIVIME